MHSISSFPAPPATTAQGLASWYTPGLLDGFGDRLLMFDNTDTEALELLRFNAALAATPGFEDALRERVRKLRLLTHAAFPLTRAVKRLESDGSLALVSTHMPGKRLSAVFTEPRHSEGLHPAFVTWVLSQVIQPLSILHAEGEDVAHGALTADRIILTPGGRVGVVEHVLGSALRQLDPSSAHLWREFGLLARVDHGGAPQLDARGDVFQLGALAVSLLLARRITPADLEQRLPLLLDQCSEIVTARSAQRGQPLRLWLERALQIGERPYRSAAEAGADLGELPSTSAARALEFLQSGHPERPPAPFAIVPARQEVQMSSAPQITDVSPATPENRMAAALEAFPAELGSLRRSSQLPDFTRVDRSEPKTLPRGRFTVAFRSLRTSRSIAVALVVIALAQGAVIATLMMRAPLVVVPTAAATSASPEAARIPADNTPSQVVTTGLMPAAVPAVAVQSGVGTGAAALDTGRRDADAAIARAASNQRSGGVRLSAPIELKVLLGDRVLGSSADGPIVTTAGTHQLDLINTALGFRARQEVTFRAGEIRTVAIPVPRGRISLNARPWAEVWIDSSLVGQTPLANVDVPLGEHEVVFRHPELGERRQTVVVRADADARVSTIFER
jgi:hypothetical protein